MVNILIVEDSPVTQQFLEQILNSDPGIQVIGIASGGDEALKLLQHCKPDVVTMDVHMPKMDGLEATGRIMELHPVPIVIVSASWQPWEVDKTFLAMQAGAVAVIEKPVGFGHPKHAEMVSKLTDAVKLMAAVKVVGRLRRATARPTAVTAPRAVDRADGPVSVVAIGASVGGPPALQTLLALLTKDFCAPILIVQHIAENFIAGMATWLSKAADIPVHLAEQGERPLPGHVYLATDGRHMGVTVDRRLVLVEDPPEHGARPSVSYLFRSVAKVFGKTAIGVLLTGMGQDGAAELKEMRDRGATTLAQDKASSVVNGMPGAAVALDAAMLVLSPERIAAVLNRINAAQKRKVA